MRRPAGRLEARLEHHGAAGRDAQPRRQRPLHRARLLLLRPDGQCCSQRRPDRPPHVRCCLFDLLGTDPKRPWTRRRALIALNPTLVIFICSATRANHGKRQKIRSSETPFSVIFDPSSPFRAAWCRILHFSKPHSSRGARGFQQFAVLAWPVTIVCVLVYGVIVSLCQPSPTWSRPDAIFQAPNPPEQEGNIKCLGSWVG